MSTTEDNRQLHLKEMLMATHRLWLAVQDSHNAYLGAVLQLDILLDTEQPNSTNSTLTTAQTQSLQKARDSIIRGVEAQRSFVGAFDTLTREALEMIHGRPADSEMLAEFAREMDAEQTR